jgi:hypothetical protein
MLRDPKREFNPGGIPGGSHPVKMEKYQESTPNAQPKPHLLAGLPDNDIQPEKLYNDEHEYEERENEYDIIEASTMEMEESRQTEPEDESEEPNLPDPVVAIRSQRIR